MSRSRTHPPKREVGFSEGIDDAAVALAFSKLQKLPQFKFVRKIPLNIVLKHEITENTRILDFGCGSGHFLVDLFQVLKRRKISPKLYGLDIAQIMLDQCEFHLNQKNISGIKLLLGDGVKIPVKDIFFDIISTSLSLHHWENPEEVLTEIYRVLKPRGLFILFDFHRAASKRWYSFLKFITQKIVPKALRAANEPLGSLLASYTESEITQFIVETPWIRAYYHCKITYHGPFIRFVFLK